MKKSPLLLSLFVLFPSSFLRKRIILTLISQASQKMAMTRLPGNQPYFTIKPIKTIAWELGYDDEFYFSRFFKTNADVSPQLYRETVGFARGEVQ